MHSLNGDDQKSQRTRNGGRGGTKFQGFNKVTKLKVSINAQNRNVSTNARNKIRTTMSHQSRQQIKRRHLLEGLSTWRMFRLVIGRTKAESECKFGGGIYFVARAEIVRPKPTLHTWPLACSMTFPTRTKSQLSCDGEERLNFGSDKQMV